MKTDMVQRVGTNKERVSLGSYRFDRTTSELVDEAGEMIALRPQSIQVLQVLVDSLGEVVPKDDLITSVWGNVAVTDDSLTQCVADIRRALGDPERKILQTFPKKGYRLVGEVEGGRPSKRPYSGFIQQRMLVIAVLAFIAVIGVVALVFDRQPEPVQITESGIKLTEPSIAVLPFDSVTGDEKWDRLGRAVATDIANELARNDWLYVTAPESTWQITAKPVEAGRDLNVRLVLDGSIQEDAGRVRVSANMTDAASGEILWSDRWTEDADDIFAIQDHIVERIGTSLSTSYTGAIQKAELARALRRPTSSFDAYEHYLIGVELKHTFDPDNFPGAVEHLEKAIQLDPEFARAWAALGLVKGWIGSGAPAAEAERLNRQSIAAAHRAFQLDPDEPEVLYVEAMAHAKEGNFTSARSTLRKAVELAPNNADVLVIAGWIGANCGITGPEPLSWVDRAYDLNPNAPAWYSIAHGSAAVNAGEYQLAIDVLATAPLDYDKYVYSAVAQALLGDLGDARRNARQLKEFDPGFVLEEYEYNREVDRPDRAAFFRGARLAGIPITREDLRLMNAPVIAVMPFETVAAEERWSGLARGFASEIAGELYRYDTIRTLNLSFAPDPEPIDADAILIGSVQSNGETLRVSVTLTDTATNETIWAQKWAGPESVYFEIQDRTVAGIVGALGATWHGVFSDRVVEAAKRHPSSLDAFENFLIGAFSKHENTKEGFAQARSHLTRALELDPQFSKAWATLSYLNVLQAFVTDDPELRQEMYEGAIVASEQAMKTGADDPDALVAGAHYLANEGRYEEAKANIRRAVALAPRNPDLLAVSAIVGTNVAGLGIETLEWANTAMDLNPNPPIFYWHGLGYSAFSAGEYETVISALSGPAQTAMASVYSATAALELGLPKRAEEARQAFFEKAPPDATVDSLLKLGFNADTPATRLLRAGAGEAGIPVSERVVDSR